MSQRATFGSSSADSPSQRHHRSNETHSCIARWGNGAAFGTRVNRTVCPHCPVIGEAAKLNSRPGYFGLLKRGVMGTYHHWSHQHLHRYLRLPPLMLMAILARSTAHDGAIKRARQLVPARRAVRLRFRW